MQKIMDKRAIVIFVLILFMCICALLFIKINAKKSEKMVNISCKKFGKNSTEPPFLYPNQIPQPAGPEGWGFRDQNATKKTLEWQESQPMQLVPNLEPQRSLVGYHTHMVESQPVERKLSPFEATAYRPVVPYIRPRSVATAFYSNW